MSYKEKYLKYKKKYIDLKKQSIIRGGKPIHYFNDFIIHPDIYYIKINLLIIYLILRCNNKIYIT